MEIRIDVYFKNQKTGKFNLLRETITEDDIERLAQEKAQENQPMWLSEDHVFHSTEIDEISIK